MRRGSAQPRSGPQLIMCVRFAAIMCAMARPAAAQGSLGGGGGGGGGTQRNDVGAASGVEGVDLGKAKSQLQEFQWFHPEIRHEYSSNRECPVPAPPSCGCI